MQAIRFGWDLFEIQRDSIWDCDDSQSQCGERLTTKTVDAQMFCMEYTIVSG